MSMLASCSGVRPGTPRTTATQARARAGDQPSWPPRRSIAMRRDTAGPGRLCTTPWLCIQAGARAVEQGAMAARGRRSCYLLRSPSPSGACGRGSGQLCDGSHYRHEGRAAKTAGPCGGLGTNGRMTVDAGKPVRMQGTLAFQRQPPYTLAARWSAQHLRAPLTARLEGRPYHKCDWRPGGG